MSLASKMFRESWGKWIAPVALVAALTWCSSITLPVWGQPRFGTDKVVHFLLFGLLANLVARVDFVQRLRPFGIYTAVMLVCLFGVFDEWHQSLTPGRSVDVSDWMADALGALIAVALYVHSTSYREKFDALVSRVTSGPFGSTTRRRAATMNLPDEAQAA